jgi:haloalkane dehalogenase
MSADWQQSKRYLDVLGRRMAYVEEGAGAPIVLLHGNPTSSYLWRSVIPELTGSGRCVAPDLIGMGDSDKLPREDLGRYTFTRHRDFLDGFLDGLAVNDQLTLVVHDWGSALGFDWARRHPDQIRGIAYMEALVGPINGWGQWPEAARSILPTLIWPRQIPIAGEPADVHAICSDYARWLSHTPGLPKLFVNADPGTILTGAQREFCRTWPDQTEVTVPGIHFIQEDSGPQIGRAISAWLADIS